MQCIPPVRNSEATATNATTLSDSSFLLRGALGGRNALCLLPLEDVPCLELVPCLVACLVACLACLVACWALLVSLLAVLLILLLTLSLSSPACEVDADGSSTYGNKYCLERASK